MSAKTTNDTFYRDLFGGLGAITTRPMMGGLCIYAEGQLFAAVHSDGGLYLRSKGRLAERLKEAGERQFVWTRPSDGKAQAMGYWSLPEAALDDPALACDLAREALKDG